MPSKDYIPDPDDQFDHWIDAYAAYLSGHLTQLELNTAAATELTSAADDWNTKYAAYLAAKNAYEQAVIAKDEARRAAEPVFRKWSQVIQANKNVPDTARVAIGLPVRKTHGTPVGDLDTWPILYRVDQEPQRHRLWFSDNATPGSKALPAGALFCEIRETVVAPGGAAPTDPEAMRYLCTESKVPHRNDFEAAEKGHTAYYAQRWVNTRHVPGPWGPITGYLVT